MTAQHVIAGLAFVAIGLLILWNSRTHLTINDVVDAHARGLERSIAILEGRDPPEPDPPAPIARDPADGKHWRA